MMTVAELIAHLQTFPQDLQVTYSCCSEQVLLQSDDVYTYKGCKPRSDGWVQNERPDMPEQTYLGFPGN